MSGNHGGHHVEDAPPPRFCVACRAPEFHPNCSLIFPLAEPSGGFTEPTRLASGRAGLDLPYQGDSGWYSDRPIWVPGAGGASADDTASVRELDLDDLDLD
jgi:hypothetical protein